MRRIVALEIILLLLSVTCVCLPGDAAAGTTFVVGFFEPGEYPAHSQVRDFVREQLPALAPAGVTFDFPPSGFKSAGWSRDKSRQMAADLTADTTIDAVLALGPWTVEDLLAAGFNRPIVAALRFDPADEGLLDSLGHPIVPNLTVRLRTNKIVNDLNFLNELKPLKRLGFLHFPSGGADSVAAAVQKLAKTSHVEVVTAEGFDREGTYAFFRAFQAMDKNVDALYLPPLWGCDDTKMRAFFEMVSAAGIPVFSAEGVEQCARGALASGSVESDRAAALFAAWKIARIAAGVPPSDLPLQFSDHAGLTVNEVVARDEGIALPSEYRPDVQILAGPASDEVERLTLVDAVQKALMQNPGYQARYQALRSASQMAGRARAALLPSVKAGASFFHFNDNAVNNDDRYEPDRVRAGIYVEQEIFSLGTIRDAQAAGVDRNVSTLDQRQAALDLEEGVTLAFLNCLRAQQTAAQLKDVGNRTRACRQIADLRDNLETGSSADAIRWETAWMQTWADETNARTELKIAKVLLNGLLGRPGDFPFVLDDQGLDDPAFFAQETVLSDLTATPAKEAEMVAHLLGLSTDSSLTVTRAALEIDRERLALKRNSASFMPNLGFEGGLEYTDEWAERDEFREKNPSWWIGAKIELPLFLGGSRVRERNALKAELGSRQFLRDDAALETANDVRVETEALLSNAYRFPPTARAAERAQEYFDLVLSDYTVGRRTVAEMYDALANVRTSALDAIAIESAYFRSTARLTYLIGLAPHEHGNTPGQQLILLLRAAGQ